MEELKNELPYENEEAILPEEDAPAEVQASAGEGQEPEAVQEAQEAPAQPVQKSAARDYAREVQALYAARPELRGQDLPPEVARACVSGQSLVEAYNDFARRQRQDAGTLRKENRILRQNAATAARAPVRGVTRGGSTEAQPEDAFLRGFNEGW